MKKLILPFGIILALFVVLVIVLFIFFSRPNNGTTEDFKAQAEQFFEDKKYSKSVEYYKKAVNQDPTNSDYYVKISDIYVLKNDYESALTILKSAIENKVSDELAINKAFTKVNFLKRDFKSAEEYSNKVLEKEKNPDIFEIHFYSLTHQNQLASAKTKLENFLNDESLKNEKLFLLGGLLNYTDSTKALDYLTKVSKPDDAEKNDTIKVMRQRAEDLRQFIVSIKDDTTKEKELVNKLNVARIMVLEDLNFSANVLLDEVISKNSDYYASYLFKGISFAQERDFDKAKENLEKADGLASSKEEVLIYLATVYEKLGNIDKSISTYQRLIAVNPESEQYGYEFASMLRNQKQFNQVVTELQKLINKNSAKQYSYKVELAEVYTDNLANYDEVLKITDELLNKWTGFASLDVASQARIYELDSYAKYKKNYDASKSESSKILSDAIKSIESSYNLAKEPMPRLTLHLGLLYLEKQDFNKAKEYLEYTVDLDNSGYYSNDAKSALEKIKD